MEHKTILVVDDAPSNLDMVVALLSMYDTIPVLSGEEALAVLEQEKVDLVLLDIVMPKMDGFEVCRRLKAEEKWQEIPVIFITSKSDEASIEEAYSVGGVDYVVKPFRPLELLARVKTQLEYTQLLHTLRFFASYDELTKIYNRRKFFELAQRAFDESKLLCVAMIDIDRFKLINDTYGHHNGDSALKAMATHVQAMLEEGMIFARVGGEEFVLLSTHGCEASFYAFIERVRIALETMPIVLDDGRSIHCTISCGVALKSSQTPHLDALLQEADAALYEAKKDGRNKTIFRSYTKSN